MSGLGEGSQRFSRRDQGISPRPWPLSSWKRIAVLRRLRCNRRASAPVSRTASGEEGRDDETGGHSSGPAIPAATLWLDDFAVDSQATVEPHLYHLRRSETNVFLTGAADPGVPVVLQASDQLGSWIDVQPLVTPESGQLLFTVPHDGKNAQFYRLRH